MTTKQQTMPNKDNASTSDRISDLIAQHTEQLLTLMQKLVAERDDARAALREKEATEDALYAQIQRMERDYDSLKKSYSLLREQYLKDTGKPDLYPYRD